MLIKEMVTASETRQSVHGMTFPYELKKYPFRDALEKLFGLELQDLHLWLGDFEKFDRKNDQQTIVHRVFYSNYSNIIEPIIRILLNRSVDFPFHQLSYFEWVCQVIDL